MSVENKMVRYRITENVECKKCSLQGFLKKKN